MQKLQIFSKTRAGENTESARSAIYAIFSAHSAYFNALGQKVPYRNVSRQIRVIFYCFALSGSLRLCLARCPANSGSLWPSLALCGSLWLPPALSGCLWLSIALRICLQSPCLGKTAVSSKAFGYLCGPQCLKGAKDEVNRPEGSPTRSWAQEF